MMIDPSLVDAILQTVQAVSAGVASSALWELVKPALVERGHGQLAEVFEREPADNSAKLREALEEVLEEDPALLDQVTKMLEITQTVTNVQGSKIAQVSGNNNSVSIS